MFHAGPVTMAMPVLALVGLALTVVVIVLGFARRVALPRGSALLIAPGLILLAVAAGRPTLDVRDEDEVVVMVDLSPSTRTARYRDVEFLKARIPQLLGGTPYRTVHFADGRYAKPPPAASMAPPDLPTDETRYVVPDAAAVVLFSDAQFDLPTVAPPTYVVVDPLLQSPADASVEDIEFRPDGAAATVENRSADVRTLTWLPTRATHAVPAGAMVFVSPSGEANEVVARLSGGDPWPENDVLRIHAPPPATPEQWWVGNGPAPEGWRRVPPSELTTDPASHLAPSVIALDNIPATALSDVQRERLHQYVRDLGGALMILGGDRAFAAGAYTGSSLDTLSPLSGTPPTPAVHWIFLADSSGSMAAAEAGTPRWDALRHALRALLPHLPPDDPVSIGSFAESLRWWSTGRSVRETREVEFPNIAPHGPTNLEAALNAVISQSDASMPKELLLLTDADAQLTQLNEIQTGLREKGIRLHLLALRDDGRALKELERVVTSTNGQSLRELDPGKWTVAVRRLFQNIAPDLLINDPVSVAFVAPLDTLPERQASPTNRTWLKPDAKLLARSEQKDEVVPLAASWKVGAGAVVATAFQATPAEREALARLVEQPPRDPRFTVQIKTGTTLTVTVDAADKDEYLNNLPLTLELTDLPPTAARKTHAVPQSAPGRYELSLRAPDRPMLATVRHEGQTLARRALAARYPREFEAIGNNLFNARELASRTGGAVIPPTKTTPIQFDFPTRAVSLTSWTAAAGALLLAAGLVRWRLG